MTWRNTNLENITETYYDTAGRLKTQKIKLERLQKLLSQAENMEDIITIESAISETEWNIETFPAPCGTMTRWWTSPPSTSMCRRSISIPTRRNCRRISEIA